MSEKSITFSIANWSTTSVVKLIELADQLDAEANGVAASVPPADMPEDFGEPSGWTQEAYIDVLTNLLRHHHVQVAVIFEAIENGTGYVSRERVYELGHYSADRSLKGFTRPVNRFTADAVEGGLLEEDADDLLAPDYDPNVSGFQRARGFRVPLDVVRLAEKWRAESEVGKR